MSKSRKALVLLSVVICFISCGFWIRSLYFFDRLLLGTPWPRYAEVGVDAKDRFFVFSFYSSNISDPSRPNVSGFSYSSYRNQPGQNQWAFDYYIHKEIGYGHPPDPNQYHRLISANAYIPIWFFIITTVISGILWLILPDRRRALAGMCKTCGYDLRFSSTECCPECGSRRGVGTKPRRRWRQVIFKAIKRGQLVIVGVTLIVLAAGLLPMIRHMAAVRNEMVLDIGGHVKLKLVEVPSGKFVMGRIAKPYSDFNMGNHDTRHEVTLTKSFYMGMTHVTVDQFAAFVKDTGYQTDAERIGQANDFARIDGGIVSYAKKVAGVNWKNPGFLQRGDHPVVVVSWNDAMAFCDWLSKRSGKKISLPTMAQWEYACRAETTTEFPWGDGSEDGEGYANCADQSLRASLPNEPTNKWFFNWDDGFVFTSPTQQFKPNAFGLYDMMGNAMHWCYDGWNSTPTRGAVVDPVEHDGKARTIRGASWLTTPEYCYSGHHNGILETAGQAPYLGFRIICQE